MNSTDGSLNFSTYKQEDLKSCLVNIDKDKFPKNYSALLVEIDARNRAGTWDETDSEFQDLIANQRGVWAIVVIAYIPLFYLTGFVYRSFAERETPFVLQVAFGIFYFSAAFFIRMKLSQKKCPNCDTSIGLLGLRSTMASGKCPNCGYQPK